MVASATWLVNIVQGFMKRRVLAVALLPVLALQGEIGFGESRYSIQQRCKRATEFLNWRIRLGPEPIPLFGESRDKLSDFFQSMDLNQKYIYSTFLDNRGIREIQYGNIEFLAVMVFDEPPGVPIGYTVSNITAVSNRIWEGPAWISCLVAFLPNLSYRNGALLNQIKLVIGKERFKEIVLQEYFLALGFRRVPEKDQWLKMQRNILKQRKDDFQRAGHKVYLEQKLNFAEKDESMERAYQGFKFEL